MFIARDSWRFRKHQQQQEAIVKVIYLAGPMRGYPSQNFPAFFAMEEELKAQGHSVFNPAANDIAKGYTLEVVQAMNEKQMANFVREAMADDARFICREATHIYMLPGWRKSKGATAEHALALAIGIEVEGAEA